jgi:hypothetical protein
MICPACPAIAGFSAAIAAYFGFDRPDLRIINIAITASLMVITTIALKAIFGLSLCDGTGEFTFRNFAQVGTISAVSGFIYSIGVSYLLNIFVPLPAQPEPNKPCCCIKNDNNKV